MTQATASKDADTALAYLRARKDAWAALPIRARVEMLLAARSRLKAVAARWIELSAAAKQLDPKSPWVGEEWVTGPWAVAAGINGYVRTLEALDAGRLPKFSSIRMREDGRLAVGVFPPDRISSLLLSGITSEVWMRPGITIETLQDHVGTLYRDRAPRGELALVLGAGNINGIPPLDALSLLIGRRQSVVLKMNPINDYLGPLLEDVFRPFVEFGCFAVVYGGADVGSYLAYHDAVDAVHITGSARTHDAIVFGPGPEGNERKRLRRPLLQKKITSELGGVGPCIVVPGPWTDSDLRFQAENIATMRLHNSGHNCVATQVLVLPAAWEGSEPLLDHVRQVMRELPPRPATYPGTAARYRLAALAHPNGETFGDGEVPRTLVTGARADDASEFCFREEIFGPVLAQTSLPGATPEAFLGNAVRFANEMLAGTLGATLLVHPKTIRRLGPELDAAVAGLRYGAVGINIWNAAAFLIVESPWGAHPGHPLHDIGSGTGFVHNTFMLEGAEKTVVRGSFHPFPRTLVHGSGAFLPKPPWFVTHRNALATGRRFAYAACSPGYRHVPGIAAAALLG